MALADRHAASPGSLSHLSFPRLSKTTLISRRRRLVSNFANIVAEAVWFDLSAGNSNVVSLCSTLLVRVIVGPLVDRMSFSLANMLLKCSFDDIFLCRLRTSQSDGRPAYRRCDTLRARGNRVQRPRSLRHTVFHRYVCLEVLVIYRYNFSQL